MGSFLFIQTGIFGIQMTFPATIKVSQHLPSLMVPILVLPLNNPRIFIPVHTLHTYPYFIV